MITPQSDFTKALLDPDLATPSGVIDPQGQTTTKRFNVYRNNVLSSLINAMQTAFPVTHKIVGTAFFNAMCGIYVRQYPPSTPLLMFYGENFPTFLEQFEPVSHLPYMADVATFELNRRLVYHASDASIIEPQVLMGLSGEQLLRVSFSFIEAMKIQKSTYPIQSIWDFNMTGAPAPDMSAHETVLLARPHLDISAYVIDDATSAFLMSLQDKVTLQDALDVAMSITPDFAFSDALNLILSAGIISKIHLPETSDA